MLINTREINQATKLHFFLSGVLFHCRNFRNMQLSRLFHFHTDLFLLSLLSN